MRDWTIVAIIAAGIWTVGGYFYVGKPYLYRRRLQIAEEEVKMLMKGKEAPAAPESNDR